MSALHVRPGYLIRTRPHAGSHWSYGVIVRQEASGLVRMLDERGRRQELPSIDASWMWGSGNLQVRRP